MPAYITISTCFLTGDLVGLPDWNDACLRGRQKVVQVGDSLVADQLAPEPKD